MPALRKLGIEPTLLFDLNRKRAQDLSRTFKEAMATDSLDAQSFSAIDAALVATPPHAHAPLCVELLRNGKHVFVEKPMTITVDEALSVVTAAEQRRLVLGVGYVHRFSHIRQWIHALINSRRLGIIKRFDIRKGEIFGWDIKTDATWRRDQTGGGVLIDIGTHILDMVSWLLGDVATVEYCDDSYGGVEADCLVDLTMNSGATGVIELSRTRRLRNTAIIEGTDGRVEFTLINQNKVVSASPEVLTFEANGVRPATMPAQIIMGNLFADQLRLWFNAIEVGIEPPVSGLDGLRATELVARCYAVRREWKMPWVAPQGHKATAPEVAHA